MRPAVQPELEATEELSLRGRWDAAVGKVFKLVHKEYGLRLVTFTQINAIKDADTEGAFDIEVLCVEISARILSGKRAHGNICKEGVFRQEADGELLPESFGTECSLVEFGKVTHAILTYTNTYLDWVMQPDSEEHTETDVAIDLPYLKLTDMEASLVRNSPFLVKDVYFLTPNSIAAAQASVQQELDRALRNLLLVDAVDASYLDQKNEAITSLQTKLRVVAQEAEAQRILASVEIQQHDNQVLERRRPGFAALQIDSLTLALLGKPSATSLRWMMANPSEEGPVYCLAATYSPLEFVRWAHVSGKAVPEAAGAGRKLQEYFRGMNRGYTGPDRDGVYPLLKPATE